MELLRILIADDEDLDRKLIAHLLAGCGFAKERMLFASDGAQVVSIAKAEKPDLIVLDILMPVISGLEALRQIRQFDQAAKVIIISAYDEFDYAKEAMAEGASAYLLKPIKPQELKDLISNLTLQLTEQRQQAANIAAIKAQFLQSLPILQQGFLSDLLAGTLVEFTDQQIKERGSLLDIQQIPNTVMVAGLYVPDGTEAMGKELNKQKAASALKELFAQEEIPAFVSVPSGADKLVVLLEGKGPSYKQRREVGLLGERLGLYALQRTGTKVIIGIGRTYGSFRELPQSYAEASQALEQATLLGDSYAHIDDLEEAPLGARYQTLLPKLVGYAQVGKADRAEELLARIWKLAEGDLESKKLQALKILDTVTAVENSPQRNLALRLTNQKEVTGCADSQEIYLFLRRFLRQQVEALSQRRKWRNKSLMDRALAFIEENYANAITLDEVAEHVNLSPAYFSSVFKQELGKSFVEALNSFRIEQSKKLLADPLLNVSEVGYKVGFNDQSYFTRVFKKITGVTPTQWREHN